MTAVVVAAVPYRSEILETCLEALKVDPQGTASVGFWMNLQSRYDVRVAERAIAADLRSIETYEAA